MNLDNLISKYLDGELSRSEDVQLRKILSEDISAREEFDAHVLIHAAMKEDARNIKPSLNLVGRTEDRILSMIMAEQPKVTATIKTRRRKPVLAFASLVALLLVFGIFSIMDNYYFIGNDDITDALQKERSRIVRAQNLIELGISEEFTSEPNEYVISEPESNDLLTSNSYRATNRLSSNQQSANLYGGEITAAVVNRNSAITQSNSIASGNASDRLNVQNNNILSSNNNYEVTEEIIMRQDENSVEPTMPVTILPTDFASNLSKLQMNDEQVVDYNSVTEAIDEIELEPFSQNKLSAYINTYPDQSSKLNQGNTFGNQDFDMYYGQPSQINLNTFFGSEIAHGGFGSVSPDIISNFSQSLGYELNEQQQFGLEIGFTKYSYEETKIGRIPNIVNIEPNYNGQNRVEVRENGSGNPGYIEFPYTIETEQQMMWGAAYFDQRLINAGDFSLSGRLSLGATNKGPLGYGRVYARYNLWNWFSLNLGADGKAFWWDNQAFGENSTKIKTSLSIIYGFEIRI